MKKTYRVEYWDKAENNWIVLSRHLNRMNAEINAEVKSKSRKCAARVIYDGKIIYEVKA